MIVEAGAKLLVSGPMTVDTATELVERGVILLTGERELDLSGVTRVDSSAVAVVLAWLRATRSAGFPLRLTGVPPAFASLARLYGVDVILAPHLNPA